MLNNNKNKKTKKNWLFGAILSFYVLKKFFKMRKNREIKEIEHNFKDFLKEEGKEIRKYRKGKESIGEFAEDSGSLFKDYFIPHSGNNHMPRILHTKSLAFIVILTLILKFSLVAYLYFVFPNSGKADNLMVPKILELVNKERQDNSLKPLVLNAVLSNSALTKANDMVTNDYFSHTSPDGRKPWDFINRSMYAYNIVGENLAMNFSSAESAHKALVNSPSHKHNLLNEKYQDIGLAVVSGEVGGKTTNVLVQLFSSQISLEDSLKDKNNIVKEPMKAEVVSKAVIEPVEVLSSEKDTDVKEVIAPTSKANEGIVAEKPVQKPETVKEVEKQVPIPAKQTDTKPMEVQKIIPPVKETLVNVENVENMGNEVIATATVPVAKTMKIIKHPGDQVLSQYVEESLSIEQSEIAEKENSLATMNLGVENATDNHFIFSKRLIYVIQIAIASLLSLLIISLLLNIFIRFEIQHKPVLLRAVLVVVFVAALLFINFHYLEAGTTMIYMS